MASFVCHLDESIPGDVSLMVTAGFIARAERMTEIAEAWRSLKADGFDVDPDLELKYTLTAKHPSREALDGKGWSQQARVPLMLETIREVGVTVIADVVYPVKKGLSAKALYLDGFGWCVRRHMNHVGYEQGPHWVVVDYPPSPGDLEGARRRSRKLHRFVGTAAFYHYKQLYWTAESLPGGGAMPALRDRGFVPELAAGHARHSELLQIADVVAGCFRDFTHQNLSHADDNGQLPPPTWREENLAIIAPLIRRSDLGSVRGWGFDVFPSTHPARDALIARVDAL